MMYEMYVQTDVYTANKDGVSVFISMARGTGVLYQYVGLRTGLEVGASGSLGHVDPFEAKDGDCVCPTDLASGLECPRKVQVCPWEASFALPVNMHNSSSN